MEDASIARRKLITEFQVGSCSTGDAMGAP
jgi:hypothetical protein